MGTTAAAVFAQAMNAAEGQPAAPSSPAAEGPRPIPGMPGDPVTPPPPAVNLVPAQQPEAPTPAATPEPPADPATPAAPAAQPPSDKELFGEVALPWEDQNQPDLDADPATPQDQTGGGLTPEQLAEVKSLLGDGSKNLTGDEQKRLHTLVFLLTPRGRHYHEAHQTVRALESDLGREVKSVEDLQPILRSARTLDEVVSSVKSGPEGARQALSILTTRADGSPYPWAPNVLEAARHLVSSDIEQARQQSSDSTYQQLLDQIGQDAAAAYADERKDLGDWLLRGLNVLYHARNPNRPHPQGRDIQAGKYVPSQTAAAPASTPSGRPSQQQAAQPASDDPEKEQMRQELNRLRGSGLQQQARSWGDRADQIVQTSAEVALAPLKELVEAGVISQRVYETELDGFFRSTMDSLGPQSKSIGDRVLEAIRSGDRAALDFQTKQFQTAVGASVRKLRLEVLGHYRSNIEDHRARARDAQSRQLQAGQKTEATAAGSPAPPTATPKGPDGTREGGRDYLRSIMGSA